MTDYWILLATLGMALLALVFAFTCSREHMERTYSEHTLLAANAENVALSITAHDLQEKLTTQENYYKLYVTENEELTDKIGILEKRVTTLNDLLTNLSAENEALHKAATAPLPIPARPAVRRATMRKVGKKNHEQ